jgi:hypothetical protein
LLYVLAVWIVSEGIALFLFAALSLARFSKLLPASLRASASAMWLVPGTLLLASRSQLAVAAGLALVINAARLLASSRAPKGATIARKRRVFKRRDDEATEPLLFRCQSQPSVYFSRQTVPTILGALALQMGIYALAGDYPLLAAVSFAAATAVWVAQSVARGAMAAGSASRQSAPGIVVTLLLTVTLTAVLVQTEIVREAPVVDAVAREFLDTPGITSQLLERLAHVPPAPFAPPKVASAAARTVATRIVDPTPATESIGGKGVPGVVLRPRAKPHRPTWFGTGPRLAFSSTRPLAIPFTGEYRIFRTSSGGLPTGALVETGTPLDNLYGTTNGGPMDTVAVQTFGQPLDLTDCGRVLVALTSAETMPLLASMQLVAQGRLQDAGTELMGMKQAREETLEFRVPVTGKPLLVSAIWISFQRPGSNRNPRVAVEGFTLLPRGNWE